MKKAGLIFGIVYVSIIFILLLILTGFIFNKSIPYGFLCLAISLIGPTLSILVLVFVYMNLDSKNKIGLSILTMALVSIVSGILFILEEDELIDVDLEKRKRRNEAKHNGFSAIMVDLEQGNFKCELCGSELKAHLKNTVVVYGKKTSICDKCLNELKENNDNIIVLEKSMMA